MGPLRQVLRGLRMLVKRVPFYQLSALSMLAGCYTLNNALARNDHG